MRWEKIEKKPSLGRNTNEMYKIFGQQHQQKCVFYIVILNLFGFQCQSRLSETGVLKTI